MATFSTPLEALLGPTLRRGAAAIPTSSLAASEVVGLYFSAHWCPPCRGFTPKLAATYKDLVASGKKLEIVFVSSDSDQASFDSYFGEMPWCALPFEERQLKEKLSRQFKVSGIPTLVLLDGKTGALLTTDGRATISNDPKGEDFPWHPKTVAELLGDTLRRPDGSTVPLSGLAGKQLAIYFSAHWCPPCRGFTPVLSKTYEAMKAAGRDDVEFIFVSSDKDEAAFNEYAGSMPWLSLPFARRKEKEALSSLFNVEGIPTLVTLAADHSVVNTSARGPASKDPTGAAFPWIPAAVEDLAETVECNGFDVNSKAAVAVLCDGGSPDLVAACTAGLTTVAEAHNAADKAAGGEPGFIYFVAGSGGGAVSQVKKLCGLDGSTATPSLLLLDIPDDGGFYTAPMASSPGATEVAAAVEAFLAAYAAKTLTRQQLKK